MSQNADKPLKLWVVMNRALGSISQQLRRQVESHDISFTEFAVLEVLLHKGTLPIGEIGGRVLLTSGSMTYVIDKLEQRGLIRRRACESDRRVIYGELTQEGRSFIEPVFQEHAERIRDMMSVLTPDEQEAAVDMIRRIGLNAVSKARLQG